MDPTLDDIEFLASSQHRVGVLDALNETPCDRRDLRTATGASSATVSRILSDLEDCHWITREGRTYRVTDLGEFVATRLSEFRDAMHLERTLREVWSWRPYDIDDFSVELSDDVMVSRPDPGYPCQPVERITDLVREAEMMRGFGMVMLESSNLEVFFTRSLDDLRSDYVCPPEMFEQILAWNPEAVRRTSRPVIAEQPGGAREGVSKAPSTGVEERNASRWIQFRQSNRSQLAEEVFSVALRPRER